jgi:hypothetical protein
VMIFIKLSISHGPLPSSITDGSIYQMDKNGSLHIIH